MSALRALMRSNTGAAAIEFAVLSPVFFAMLFGIIEFSRLAWTQQSLDDVAAATVRCMSVSTACSTAAKQKTFAVNRASKLGITITASQVVPATNTSCKGYAASNSVVITSSFQSPAEGFIPSLPSSLRSHACFPVL